MRRRRQACLLCFLLDEDNAVSPIRNALYVVLVRGEALAVTLAGQTSRLAYWYVRMENGESATGVNEIYNQIRFDPQRRVDWTTMPSIHLTHTDPASVPPDANWPSAVEKECMQSVLFGATP